MTSSVRLRAVASNVRDLGRDAELPWVALEHVESGTGRLLPGFEPEIKPADEQLTFCRGDVLFGKLRPYLAKVVAPTFDGAASGEFLILRPSPALETRYLFYVSLSRPFLEWGEATSVGTKMPRTDWESMSVYRMELPTLSRQRSIVEFLDGETARIDQLIDRRKSLARLLWSRWEAEVYQATTKGLEAEAPLHETGLDWASQIPAHWTVPPVYANFDVQLGKMLNPERADGPNPAPYLRNVNVQWDRIDLGDLATMSFEEADRLKYALRPGDLLVCEGGEVGRAAVWPGDVDECYYQKAVHRVRSSGNSNVRFLMYCLWAAASMKVFNIEGNQATIVHLTAEKLRAHRFPMPPRPEQDAIVKQLDRQQDSLRTLSGRIERQVECLQEHRQALITAAVTGQIDVAEKTDHSASK